MFDKLIDWVISMIDHINPIVIIKEYQEAVLLRKGKFKKVLKAGIHFKIPFFDEFISQHVMWTTLTLPAQSLVTMDNHDIVVKSMVKYRVVDVKPFILELYDSVDAISDISQGAIKEIVMNRDWNGCMGDDLDSKLTTKIRREVKKYGVEVETVLITDIARIRTIRLINEGANLG